MKDNNNKNKPKKQKMGGKREDKQNERKTVSRKVRDFDDTKWVIRIMPRKESEKGKSDNKEKQSGKSGGKKERSSVSRKIRNSKNTEEEK